MGLLDDLNNEGGKFASEPNLYEDCPECGIYDWESESRISIKRACGNCGEEVMIHHITKDRKQVKAEQEQYNLLTQVEAEWGEEYERLSSTLQDKVLDKMTEGWVPLHMESDMVQMGRPKEAGVVKHGVVFLFTAPFTLGLGNAVYHKYKKMDMKKMTLRDEAPPTGSESPSDSLDVLQRLRDEGTISEAEYQTRVTELLDSL